jgi:branched-chain amino acid aminotransferase
MANVYCVDGNFVPEAEAVFPINDLGLLRGYGCFDFMLTYRGKVIFLKDHVQRLFRSAREIGIELPWTETEIADLVRETLRRNPPVESSVRVLVTGGPSPDFITPQGKPRIAVMVSPLSQYPPGWYAEGARIITVPYSRPIPGAKSIDYIRAILVLAEARRKGAIEAVYMDVGETVREGTTSNVFAVQNGTLVTPERGILHGITRGKVIALAEARFPVYKREITRAELVAADELFITSSNRLIVPVVRVDEDAVGAGVPGPLTRTLMRALDEYTTQLAAGAE